MKFEKTKQFIVIMATIIVVVFCNVLLPYACERFDYAKRGKVVKVGKKYATIQTKNDRWKVTKVYNCPDGTKLHIKKGQRYLVWFDNRGTKNRIDDRIVDLWENNWNKFR